LPAATGGGVTGVELLAAVFGATSAPVTTEWWKGCRNWVVSSKPPMYRIFPASAAGMVGSSLFARRVKPLYEYKFCVTLKVVRS